MCWKVGQTSSPLESQCEQKGYRQLLRNIVRAHFESKLKAQTKDEETMQILRHKRLRWNERAYGFAALWIAIGAVYVLSPFQNNATPPVHAAEKDAAPHENIIDYSDVYAENEAALHGFYLARLNLPPNAKKENGALDVVVNSLTYQGASWGLRQGHVDFISFQVEPKCAELGRSNPHEAAMNVKPKRPLDPFEAQNISKLSDKKPIIMDKVDGHLRMLGLIPKSGQCASCHADNTQGEEKNFGVFSYHFVEIADD